MTNSQPLLSGGKSDLLGALASGLCLIHCVATPFLFAAHAGLHAHHAESPMWWGLIDSVMLIVSLVAVLWAFRNSSIAWVKIALSVSWLFLAAIILNEKLEAVHLAEAWIYVPALSLIILHLYNRRYCQCD